MKLNTEHLTRCIETLDKSLMMLNQHSVDDFEYEIFRNAVVKGYELTLELSGQLLKKALKPYFANPKEVEQLVFKDIFRHAAKHGLLTTEAVQRWFLYRDNRNNTAHDYGVGFAQETLNLLPQFIVDAKQLVERLNHG